MSEQQPKEETHNQRIERWGRYLAAIPKDELQQHAAVGRICRCGTCFCCTALVYKNHGNILSLLLNESNS